MPTEYLENLGTPSGLIATNVSGTASALTANTVTTNANLSGAITSVGNVTSLGSFTSAQLAAAITDETGTSKIVFSDSPQLAGIVNISNLTASTIISADASKNVVSLALATYPSLTELSYVKGVTSGIQAQIAAIPVNPSQTGNANKVLATDGSTSSWQYAGLGAGSLGTGNTIVGRSKPSGFTGSNVTILGSAAAPSITSASDLVVIGTNAGNGVTSYSGGIFIGDIGNAAGTNNLCVAIGWASTGGGFTGGPAVYEATLIGTRAYCGNVSVCIGDGAQARETRAVAVGKGALAWDDSVAIGHAAGGYGVTQAVSIGKSAICAGTNAVVIGYAANIGSGVSSVVIGSQSGKSACSGANNTVVGADSFNGAGLTTAYDNVIVGKGSGKALTTGYNLFIGGNGAAPSATIVSDSVVIGKGSASSWVNGNSMVVIGANTSCNASAYNGVAIGTNASIGYQQSVSIGTNAFADEAAAALGWDSWAAFYSVAIGGRTRHKGNYGVMVGTLAGYNSTGASNVGVGYSALGSSTTNTGCVALGHKAGFYTTTQSNELFIDNQDRTNYAGQQTKSLMYGTFNATASSQTLTVNADLKPLALTESVTAIGTVSTTSTISILSGTVQTATLTASTSCTFTMPTATAGKSFKLYLKQAAATGLGTATFTGVKWTGAVAPTITATAGQMDILSFVADGTNWYGSYEQNYTP